MLDKIRTKDQYEAIMEMIEKYINKATKLGGFHALNKKDNEELSRLSLLANDYEKMKMLPISFKQSLNFIIQQRLEEMNINQAQLAELIDTTRSKVSKILSGKQEPDVHFLKAIHKHLGIDGNILLEAV